MRTTYLKILTAAALFGACLRFGQIFVSRFPRGDSCKNKVCEHCGGVHHKNQCN